MRMTALRETFEESGLLLVEPASAAPPSAPAAPPTPAQRAQARRAVHSRTDALTFPAFLARHHLAPPRDRLVPFSAWTTPPRAAVRFHTRFYVLFTDDLARAPDPASVVDLAHAPTADGGIEVASASWIRPRDALAAFRRAEIALFPPQYYLLTTLAGLLDSLHTHPRDRDPSPNPNRSRSEALRSAIGGFGSRQFNPRPMGFTHEGGIGQRLLLTYEGDELRGGNARDRHRCLVRYQGPVSECEQPKIGRCSPLLTSFEENSRY